MGLDDEDIAHLLDIPVESVPATLRVAAAKLTNLLGDRPGPRISTPLLTPSRRHGGVR